MHDTPSTAGCWERVRLDRGTHTKQHGVKRKPAMFRRERTKRGGPDSSGRVECGTCPRLRAITMREGRSDSAR